MKGIFIGENKKGGIMKKELLTKPNQLIEISGNISGVQTKMYNVILAKAHQELKKGDKEHFTYDLKEIKKISGVSDKNETRLRKYLKELVTTAVEYQDQKGDWGGFGLLSSFKKHGDKIRIGLPQEIRQALINNSYYSTLDLLIMKTLEGKHSITLYEIALKYHKVQIPEYSILDFREFTNTSKNKSYDDFSLLRKKVLEPSILEINEKTDINISYEPKKTGRKVTSIKFEVKKKKGFIPQKVGIEEPEVLEAEIIEDTSNLDNAILKAKKNIYVSKSWNKRVDTKIAKVYKEQGEDFTINLLDELYINLQQEVETTLIQYINGILKNIKEDAEEMEVKKPQPKQNQVVKPSVDKLEGLKKEMVEPKKSYSEEQIQEAIKKCCVAEGIEENFLIGLRKKTESVFMTTIKKYISMEEVYIQPN